MSHKTEFNASAITYVGNYLGSCLIRLNGQAIVIVRENGVEINQWPYNCIRQFRAEDETGKFSFVSGRRGPYGVAEYNFSVPGNSLIALQSALTEFTGAQFSAVAPGSGTDHQPFQPQQPLPPHSTLPRPSSSSALHSYTTSTPRHMTVGGARNEAISSERSIVDPVFSTPAHTQLPQLPPRDYSTRTSTSMSSDLSTTPLHRARATTSGTATTTTTTAGVITDVGTYSSPRPVPPRWEAKEPSPEAWVAKSTSYEEAHIQSTNWRSSAHSPPVPPKKKSFLNRLRSAGGAGGNDLKTNSEGIKRSTKSSSDIVKKDDAETSSDNPHLSKSIHRQQSDSLITNGTAKSHDSSRKSHDSIRKLHELTRKEGGEEKYVRLSPKQVKKTSPYDHLPSEKDIMEEEMTDSLPIEHNVDTSSNSSDGKQSPYLEDFSDLDHAPRSRCSPTVKTRSITPEYAHQLRMMGEEGGHSNSNGCSSHTGRPDKLSQKSSIITTSRPLQNNASEHASNVPGEDDNSFYNIPQLSSDPQDESRLVDHQTYDAPRPVDHQTYDAPRPIDDQMYDAPRPVDDQTYDAPRPIDDQMYDAPRPTDHQTYDAPRPIDHQMYDAPRPVDQSDLDGVGLRVSQNGSNPAAQDDGFYKVPTSVLVETGRDTYDAPRTLAKEPDDANVYNVPQFTTTTTTTTTTSSSGDGGIGGPDSSLYNMPRPAAHITPKNNSGIKSTPRYSYETIEINDSRPMRPSESLHKARIDPHIHHDDISYHLRSPVSPPDPTTSRGVYVDIDIERGLAPAKNAPLPPLPVVAMGRPEIATVESVYAEIPEHPVSRGGVMSPHPVSRGGVTSPHPSTSLSQSPYRISGDSYTSPTRGGLYNELPPRGDRSKIPEFDVGLSEQRKLASEGYEFCTIAPSSFQDSNKRIVRVNSPTTTTTTTSSSSANDLLQKYNINIRNSTPPLSRSRPFSVSNTLEGKSNPSLLGTSTPDDDLLTDEYVIVTGPDRRPKTGHTLPRNVPGGVITGGPKSLVDEGDEYEVMSSVFVDQTKLRSKYSTPNPSLGDHPNNNNNSVSTYTHQSTFTHASPPGERELSRSHTPPKSLRDSVQDDSIAGVNLDDMSPADASAGGGVPMYSHVFPRHQRLRSSLSVSSNASSEVTDSGDVEVSGVPIESVANKSFEKVSTGSPLDRTNSVELRSRTRSLGNILENTITSNSSSHDIPAHESLGVPAHESLGVPAHESLGVNADSSKKHNYINITPKNTGDGTTQKDRSHSAPKKKGPKPLPRNTLLRGDSVTL